MVCPVCPLDPHRSRKREMWVLWTLVWRPKYSHLALGGQAIAPRGSLMVSKNPQKIGEANGMLSLPTGPTQVTKTGNVVFVDVFRAAHLFTFDPRVQCNALRLS